MTLLLEPSFLDPLTQSWVVSAIMKIISRTTNPERLIQDIDVSLLSTADARQRYHEMRSVVKICLDLEAVLPYDASCEDIDVDVNLSFLDGFVGQALQNGALSFSPDLIHHKKSEETTGSCQNYGKLWESFFSFSGKTLWNFDDSKCQK